jgi:hypothetical protein
MIAELLPSTAPPASISLIQQANGSVATKVKRTVTDVNL